MTMGTILTLAPDLVLLPSGKDTNQTHQWLNQVFRDLAPSMTQHLNKPVVGLYNAEWKRQILLTHDSQQQRNFLKRSVGFDQRILETNRQRAGQYRCNIQMPYAEAFEIEVFDFDRPSG